MERTTQIATEHTNTDIHHQDAPMYDRFRHTRTHGVSGDGVVDHDDDRSISELVKDMTKHGQDLVRGEIDLFKSEMTTKAKAAGTYVAMGVGAAVIANVALILLGHTLAQALNAALPAWASYLIVTMLFLGIAGGLAYAALKGFQRTNLAPTDTVDSAKEDMQWVKTHT